MALPTPTTSPPSRFISHQVCSLSMPTFPVASADTQHRLGPCSGSRVFPRARKPPYYPMQMSYANELCKCKRRDIKTICLFFFFYLLAYSSEIICFYCYYYRRAACSAVMARPVGKTRVAYFIGGSFAGTQRHLTAAFPALENLTRGRNMAAARVPHIRFLKKKKQQLKECWAAGAAFKKVTEVTSGHSFHFIFLFPEFDVSQNPRTISPALFIAPPECAHRQRFRHFHKHLTRP